MGPEAPGLASPCLLPLQGIQSVKTRVFEAATPFPRCRSRQSLPLCCPIARVPMLRLLSPL